jgi:glucose dehydrogenase
MYMSAPVVADGTLYAMSNKRKGQFVALDTATGSLKWATEGREGDHASILTTPAHVLFLTNAGNLVIARKDATKFAEDRRIDVADAETWAMPVFVRGGLIVRDATGLTRLSWAK